MAFLEVDYYCDTLGVASKMNVLLPECLSEGRAKTLFLLHGMSDDHSAWMRRSSIERYAAAKNLAVIMPAGGLGWYTDMHRGLPYFTFLTQELPALCRQFFPILSDRREDTFAAGLSMGGYGALKCGLRASHLFSKVASLSGGMDAFGCAKSAPVPVTHGYWENVFGPVNLIPSSFNDLFQAAEDMKASPLRPEVYMWCGTEDFLYEANVRMRDHLRSLDYALTYEESPGDHQWLYWDQKIADVLAWLVPEEEGNPWR